MSSPGDREEVTRLWNHHQRRIEPLLAAFESSEISLRIMVSLNGSHWEVHAVLMLPTATLTSKSHSATDEISVAIDEAADRLVGEIHRHKAALRQEFLFARRRRRCGDLSGILPALEERYAKGDQETFKLLLRPALRELHDYTRRELAVIQMEGAVFPRPVSVAGLLAQVVDSAWQEFGRRPKGLQIELWLTGLLHRLLDGRAAVTTLQRGLPAFEDICVPVAASKGLHDARTERLTLADVVSIPKEGTAWERASDEEQRQWILAQLRGFSRERRRAFALYTLEGWNEDEISALQHRQPEQVLVDVHQVRDQLVSRLGDAVPT